MFALFADIEQSFLYCLIEPKCYQPNKYTQLQVELDVSEQAQDARVKFTAKSLVLSTHVYINGVYAKTETDMLESTVLKQQLEILLAALVITDLQHE